MDRARESAGRHRCRAFAHRRTSRTGSRQKAQALFAGALSAHRGDARECDELHDIEIGWAYDVKMTPSTRLRVVLVLLFGVASIGVSLGACGDSGFLDGDGCCGGGSSDGPTTATGNPIACTDETEHHGDGTYYDANGSGNCSFDPSSDLMVGAMNHTDYADSAVCGECVAIDSDGGSVTVRIVDQCPECAPGDIDLSPEAFAKLADVSIGRIDISWKVVSCGVEQPIAYHFKDGANPYWMAVQIRNAQNAILKVEAMKNGAYETLKRTDYNYFLDESGLGEGPYSFRVTDVYGHVLEDPAIPFGESKSFDGAAQFPACGQ